MRKFINIIISKVRFALLHWRSDVLVSGLVEFNAVIIAEKACFVKEGIKHILISNYFGEFGNLV